VILPMARWPAVYRKPRSRLQLPPLVLPATINALWSLHAMKYRTCRQTILLAATLPLLMQGAVAENRPLTDLVVAKNQTYRISTPQLQLQRLELQDGAVISFAPGISRALIHAERAVIGKGVRIDATGSAGAVGAAGSHWTDAAATCEPGKAGGDGAVGDNGANAVDLIVELGVERIGSLRIDADGGVGGKGGSGGDGQRGGDIDRCYGKNGGDGGNGGLGGTGGNGGAVTLRYWLNEPGLNESGSSESGLHDSSQTAAQTATDLVNAFSISVHGGNGGAGGSGGAGGGVVAGRYLSTSVGSGKKWLGAGDAGKAGVSGRAGNAGAAGSVSLMQQINEASAATKPQQVSATIGEENEPDAEMRALRKQVETLERRVKALESTR